MYQIAAVHSSGLGGEKSGPVNITTETGANVKYHSHSVDDKGGNGDGILNPGEWAYLRITLQNIGSSEADGVTATISENDPYVTIHFGCNSGSYGDISAGGTAQNYYNDYRVDISTDCPKPHSAIIYLNIKDGYGASWQDSLILDITETGANVKYHSHSVNDKGGNGDGILNPGEWAYLRITLQNIGSSEADGITATISENDPYIIIPSGDNSGSYGDISAGGTAQNGFYGDYKVTVSANCPKSHSAIIYLSIKDKYGASWQDSFKITVH